MTEMLEYGTRSLKNIHKYIQGREGKDEYNGEMENSAQR